jgi:two-component system cell cycle sensor histidine kinase/response regulator CckA
MERHASWNAEDHSNGWPTPLPATILLVEDEAAVREVTREALEIGGYRALEANGPEAAARIASDPSGEIDLLLTDGVMPGMSGPELARAISATPAGLVTVFMAGYAESDTLRAALQGVAWKHIQKPFTVDSLLAQVADALSSRWLGGNQNQVPQFSSP